MPAFISRSPIGVAAAISIAVLVVAIGIEAGRSNMQTVSLAQPVNQQNQLPSFHVEKDSDGDGLPDWQEQLIGTDPHNPDSNGDGAQDAYTPLSTALGTTSVATTSLETTLSNRVVQELMSEYVFLKQYGMFTPARGEQLGQRLSSELYTSTQSADQTYTIEDVLTAVDTSYEATLSYRSELRTALAPLLENTLAEFDLYGYAINGDAAAQTELRLVAQRYKQAATNTMQVTAPSDAAAMHVSVANSLVRFALVLEHMVEAINDPLASYALLREYNTVEREMYNAFNAQANYFSTKHREHIAYDN